MFSVRACPVILLTVSLWLAPDTSGQAAPDTPPQAPQGEIDKAVERLGSADPADREAASKYLWSLGEAAEESLQRAAEGDDLEAAPRRRDPAADPRGRAARHAEGHSRPDRPVPSVAPLGDREAVNPVLTGLTNAGPAGMHILTRLWQQEADEGRRRLLGQGLAERARSAAPVLLADGDAAAALELLEAAAEAGSPWSEPAVRDLAAVLLLRNGGAGLDDRVARLKPLVANPTGAEQVSARPAPRRWPTCAGRGAISRPPAGPHSTPPSPGCSTCSASSRPTGRNWRPPPRRKDVAGRFDRRPRLRRRVSPPFRRFGRPGPLHGEDRRAGRASP